MKTDVTTLEAKKAGTVDLPEHIFGLEPRKDILHRMVVWQLAKRRAGTHKAKTRAEVAYSGSKLFRQKGTGRARHGSRRVGVFRGGGKAFGPVSRDHAIELPKKVRALALKHALSSKAKAGELIVVDALSLKAPKTKELATAFSKLGLDNALVVDGAEVETNFRLAARNIDRVDVLPVQGINVYDILRRGKLVLTKAALEALEERFK
ncbi:50S ribosomal protein L4 [Kaustia mangrovi]|uniref:Large ribosomal subunit protein uL4 n=1 Tax=Kaustia mangrovi TaxID=2593653 RepID=A0A7S8HAE1_9HYPH|nr:50S ribosomal protein L4 [Kaustia mangrovi]QPC41341.1 50S ribosomal protein L4 [Kaustia mangrovi]